jgi:hypothetical protein
LRRKRMPVFRLTPIAGTESSPEWELTEFQFAPIWIGAPSEDDARHFAAIARPKVRDFVPGEKIVHSAWLSAAHATCEIDESRQVPEGKILTSKGRMFDVF